MDQSKIGLDLAKLLSRITGQKLSPHDINPMLLFMAALITILLGVIYADKNISAKEERRLQRMIDLLIPTEDEIYSVCQVMMGGIDWHHVYNNPNELSILTAPLSQPEILLLMALGYEMSSADGKADYQETMYLQASGNRLGANPKHLAVLEAIFAGKGTLNKVDLDMVQTLLDPLRFHDLDSRLMIASRHSLTAMQAALNGENISSLYPPA